MKRSMVEFCISLATVLEIKRLSFNFLVASFLLLALAIATIAAAWTGACVGARTPIVGNCTPLTNTGSRNNDNTALGAAALSSNTIGRFNTASGANALSSNTTGNSNTANGFNALSRNTTGNSNTACGLNALASN